MAELEIQIPDIVKIVRKWAQSKVSSIPGISAKILSDKNERFNVGFEMSECAAEVYVGEPDFAPYRGVFIQVGAIVDGKPEIVYAWYDSEKDGEAEIINELNKGFSFAVNYRPET